MNLADLRNFVDRRWDAELIPRLVEYVKVPAKSPAFDASWLAHGYLQAVVKEAHAWAAAQKIAGLKLEIVVVDGRTPCIFFDVPATGGLGNAIYAALTVIAALDAQGTARPRCVGIIESCEESGSPDLPPYLDLLAPRF